MPLFQKQKMAQEEDEELSVDYMDSIQPVLFHQIQLQLTTSMINL